MKKNFKPACEAVLIINDTEDIAIDHIIDNTLIVIKAESSTDNEEAEIPSAS